MKNLPLILVFLLVISCTENPKKKELTEAYKTEMATYWKERNESRKKSFLQLCGLFKLNDSVLFFGIDSSKEVTVNPKNIVTDLGTYQYQDSSLIFLPSKDSEIKSNTEILKSSTPLQFDEYESSQMLYWNSLRWQIITRSDQHYLRVWDSLNPAIEAFKGYVHFDLNADFIFDAQFTYYDNVKSNEVKSQLGMLTSTEFIGYVSFTYNGKSYTLDVGEEGFTMVGDETSGDTTYGGGRYMYLDLPKDNSEMVLDLNKLYNPSCSYSKYTTCLYPPHQNYLPFKVMAGETMTSL